MPVRNCIDDAPLLLRYYPNCYKLVKAIRHYANNCTQLSIMHVIHITLTFYTISFLYGVSETAAGVDAALSQWIDASCATPIGQCLG